MWAQYRKFKHWVGAPLIFLLLWLMRGDPDTSLRWTVGSALALAFGLLYVIEELIWMQIGRGRPCKHCHQMVPVKTFRLASKCPACGNTFD